MPRLDGFHHYLPVTDFVMRSGAFVTGAGRGTVPPGSDYPVVGHPTLYHFDWIQGRILPEYALILVTDGGGEFESKETGHVKIETDSTILLAPEVWHRYRPDTNSGWSERWISFNGELVHRFRSLGILALGVQPLSPDHSLALSKEFDALLTSIHQSPITNSVTLSMRAMALVTHAMQTFAAETVNEFTGADDTIVQDALEHVWTRSHYPLSVDQIAKELSVKRRTLDRRFSSARGRSILEEINFCRLTRAKRLLAETHLPIKLVTYLAGFTSNERMRLTFMQLEGMPPSEFRKQAKRNSDNVKLA